MVVVGDLKKGMIILLDGELYRVLGMQKHFTGRGSGIIKTKLKNIKTGYVIDKNFNSGEKVEEAALDYRPAEYLYHDGDNYVFMDLSTYEQYLLSEEDVSDAKDFLIDNLEVTLTFYDEKPVGIVLPTVVVLEVTETEPNFKGDTASGGGKPAILETGLKTTVPFFVEVGQKVKIDTRTGEYIERA
ncbi:elongation factor P [Marinitoga litoralis]|jgi:elongation factor P|uniref:elongation factor P n=1 Tax=Marinitoga litoralis TaxID=570855 RepID=UPI001961533E|nr:elongation factor P [Marinitoga litoralis]MBM7559190.1 elongation factor P [Marinitoga litoralis]